MTAVVPEKQYRVVSDPSIARRLIRDGFKVEDIKPKKNFPRESAFVFEMTSEFVNALEKINQEKKGRKGEE